MKRLNLGIAAAVAVFVLAGCESTPTKEQEGAAVEDRGKAPEVVDRKPVKPAEDTTKPLRDKPLAGNPLTDPGSILSKRSILFDYDSFVVKDEYKPLVTAHARYLQTNPSARMRVEGHADERGSREYNIALGQRRAAAVKRFFTERGVDGARVDIVTFGEERPTCTEEGESCYSQNRRAEFEVVSGGETLTLPSGGQ
jgi:peptidoglycan-associated lipoprotein